MECGAKYPKEPPVIHFVSQINLPGVNQQDGHVDPNAVAILRDWERIANELAKNPRPKEDPLSLESALIAIRRSVFGGDEAHDGAKLMLTIWQVYGRAQEASPASRGLQVCHLQVVRHGTGVDTAHTGGPAVMLRKDSDNYRTRPAKRRVGAGELEGG